MENTTWSKILARDGADAQAGQEMAGSVIEVAGAAAGVGGAGVTLEGIMAVRNRCPRGRAQEVRRHHALRRQNGPENLG